ncbi:hypothetical protein COU49_01905 [Candidatus Nomurabacteria bacterium CG10_big_fil_rev_8_21_14_0_10_35_16]|uniref:HD domain-containing protein n=1 Tax=Candidatus Nomurabacteria bacterium CG10_big_fil_rev_8_21_14_0_10_35_16 TaxID=1974731 RepID=A0A2H0TBA8_9BACT|nr:MAG: hypothetical protein COU49_01905 [Candidatus Nomurabacteria bacterium CG10_big_fil_rev_8_21_14_0_10_35_16]
MKKFSKKFEQLIDFINFTHEFREVVRVARSPNAKRFENDTEHSYQLAMLAWFLIEQDKLKLNKGLCLMYALSHDLVEIYAGDTFCFTKEKKFLQKERERKAFLKIKKRFPQFKGLTEIIKNYEKQKDKESKFIYALDKLIPVIQNYLEDGRLQRSKRVSFKDFLNNKHHKIIVSPEVVEYWQEILEEFTKNKKLYFFG